MQSFAAVETIARHFNVRDSTIHAMEFGEGKKLLICFPGFGEDAEKYPVLAPSLQSVYTVMAIDLPFHGKTKWKEGDIFSLHDLIILIQQILILKNKERFSLFGYSLGGKIVLASIKEFAELIDEIILAAPDGIKKNRWYDVAVYPQWGQKLFKRFIKRPHVIFLAARFLHAAAILDDRLFQFLKVQTDSVEKRRMIYNVWMALKEMECDLLQTKQLLNQYRIKSFIFIGRFDRVITKGIGEMFSKNLSDCQLVIIEKGHNLITESFNQVLSERVSGVSLK